MSNEEILKIQTCVLKVNIHCDGCQKKVKKILHKIEGVCQTRIDAKQGKVTVFGMLDAAIIIKKLNKAGKPAELWGSNSKGVMAMANQQLQKLQLDGGDKDGQSKDAGGANGGQSKEVGGNKVAQKRGAGGGAGGPSKDVKMMPQPTPQQIQQRKEMKMPQFKEEKMSFVAAAQANDPKSVKFSLPDDEFEDDGSTEVAEEGFDADGEEAGEGFEDNGLQLEEEDELFDEGDREMMMMMKQMAMPPNVRKGGRKEGNEIPVQMKGNGSNGGGKKEAGGRLNLGGNGGAKNGGGGQLNNARGGGGALVHGNQLPGQGKKSSIGGGGGSSHAVGVGRPMMPPPQQQQQTGMMRTTNMMRGGAGMGRSMVHNNKPHMGGQGAGGGNGMPAGGGNGMPAAARFYQNGIGGGIGDGGLSSTPADLMALVQQQQQHQQMQQNQTIQQKIMQQEQQMQQNKMIQQKIMQQEQQMQQNKTIQQKIMQQEQQMQQNQTIQQKIMQQEQQMQQNQTIQQQIMQQEQQNQQMMMNGNSQMMMNGNNQMMVNGNSQMMMNGNSQMMMNGNSQMMVNGNGYGQNHGGPMGYGYNRPTQQMMPSYPSIHPSPHAEPYSYFSDENPNGCSVM